MRGSGEKRRVHVRRDRLTGTSSEAASTYPLPAYPTCTDVALDWDGESNAKAARGVRDEVHPVGEDARGV